MPRSFVKDDKVDLDERLSYILYVLYPKLGGKTTIKRVGRFFGFKTTMGIDHYPHAQYGMHHLFEPSTHGYSSITFNGPCLVQGVYLADDFQDMWCENDILRVYIDKAFKHIMRQIMYSNYQNDFTKDLVEMGKDEKRIKGMCLTAVTLQRIFGEKLQPDMVVTK